MILKPVTIEIVTHVYAETLLQYAVFLRAQLSSLVDQSDTRITICYTESDQKTVDVLNGFESLLQNRLIRLPLSRGELFRRSIGRSLAALKSTADVVWFSDVDHVFGIGCLPRLADYFRKDIFNQNKMIFPEMIQIHKTHDLGDSFCHQHQNASGLITVDAAEFEPKHYHKPIGGVQIVSGDFARQFGYLKNNRRFQKPTDGNQPFPSFADDVSFRKFCLSHGPIQAIHLPNLYRLRHSQTSYQ